VSGIHGAEDLGGALRSVRRVELTSARGEFTSPVHDRLVAEGARLRDVSGWESAAWYAGRGQTPTDKPGWGHHPWFANWRAEHEAVREAVGLMDMSFMAKFAVRGPDSGVVLDRLSAGAVNERDGVITYTQWLGEDGGIRADLTVTRLAADDFLVVVSDTAHGSALGQLRRAVGDADATVEDVTTELALLTVQGPSSRATLAQAAPGADWSSEAFPFRAARRVDIAGVEVLAIRITYLGELGWELYAPASHAGEVWDAVLAAGAAHGIRPVGLKALSSLRMEKGYRDFGHDIDNTDDVYGVGLGFAVALDKPGGFVGREATLAAKERGTPHHRLVQVLLRDPQPLLFHAEPVLRDGVVVGEVRSASYGWTLGGAVGLAFVGGDGPVTPQWLADGQWEVDVAGTRHPAVVSLRPMYDPTSARVTG